MGREEGKRHSWDRLQGQPAGEPAAGGEGEICHFVSGGSRKGA